MCKIKVSFVCECYICPLSGEFQRDGFSDTTSRTCDQCGFSFQ